MLNISLPGKKQWINILLAILYSFTGAFLWTLYSAGGIQSTWEANIVLIQSAGTAAINAALYFIVITFFQKQK